ncbi:sensor histidine kinase [Pedobacter hartonius]|uniref:histidine kinase n=1 Tax=Pedobacter hartonius TaxID=425514 RepID=A0A1H3W378_9SPHI|nr:ATP-binding protein [Pedobacter hartonius]SDZ80792.1 two-component system, OmpR family, phosphate regulon sensor histidine kinase PhoR [Pedobacter hartonius]
MQSKSEQINTLTEHNDELENYFRNTIIPQLFVDSQLILRKFTPPAMKQFNLKAEHIGQPLANVKENFRFPTILDNIQHVIDSSEILEKEIQTTDRRWYQMNVLPYIVQKNNKTDGVIITFIDITARIRDLKEQEKLIAEHELLMDTIAHDIKNPLTSLSLTIEMLKKLPEKGMAKLPAMLGTAESSLMKMKDIIADLVQNRWQGQRYLAVEELLDLQNILEDVRLTLAAQLQESKAVLEVKIGISEITFARRKLRSILYNLVSNAIKYSSADRIPHVQIKSMEQDGFMVISVSDNGIGIDKQHLNTIFEKYQRVASKAEGNGVGLYLVKQTLEAAGGKVTVTSKLDEGSVFSVFLKLTE